MLETKFGPMARDGDYVIVVDFNYMKRRYQSYIARVFKNKAYTGMKEHGSNKYIHKLNAEAVIPSSYVPPDIKRAIHLDIVMHNNLSLEELECEVQTWEKL